MEKQVEPIEQRLRGIMNNIWCQTLANEIGCLFAKMSGRLAIYTTLFSREELQKSVKTVQNLNININNHEIYRNGLKTYLLLISVHTNKYFCEFFLQHLYDIHRSLTFWKFHRQNVLVEKVSTLLWPDEIRTNEKVKFLKSQENLLLVLIGRLAEEIVELEQTSNDDMQVLVRTTNHLSKIFFDRTTMNYDEQSDLTDILEFYSQVFNEFDEFQSRWTKNVELFLRPSHFRRYFPHYLTVSLLTSYGVYKIYSNRAEIRNWFSTSLESFKYFVDEHLVVPLKTIYTSTFQSRASKATFDSSLLNYQNSKKILEEMIENYGREHAPNLAQLEKVDTTKFLSMLAERAANEDMNIVMKNYQQQIDTPIRSVLFDDLIRGILIQVQKVKVDGEGLVIQIDQLMKQNQINFSLLATIPSILFLTFLSMMMKNFFANRIIKRRKLDLSSLRQAIIRKLRTIEHVLILNSGQRPMTINDHQLVFIENEKDAISMNFGHLLTSIFQLTKFTEQLNSKRMLSNEFNEDVHLLTYPQLTVEQKLLLIEQIYHSYSYLVQWS